MSKISLMASVSPELLCYAIRAISAVLAGKTTMAAA
jgi:hypothetical protein